MGWSSQWWVVQARRNRLCTVTLVSHGVTPERRPSRARQGLIEYAQQGGGDDAGSAAPTQDSAGGLPASNQVVAFGTQEPECPGGRRALPTILELAFLRRLTTDNRTLDDRLKAARSNLRFQDRRVADLEARIAEPAPTS